MSRAQDHVVTIERRARSHRAVCACGWESHSWIELRPAEADAWHHVHGEEAIVDVTQNPVEAPTPPADKADKDESRPRNVEHLVRTAQELAGGPSPYSKNTYSELWEAAGRDTVAVGAAVTAIEGLLARHERKSLGTADGEWLELMTAKRILLHALGLDDAPTSPGARR